MKITIPYKLTQILLVCGLIVLFNEAPHGEAQSNISLQDSIKLALQNDPTLKAIEAERNIAEERLKEARAGRLPTLTYDATAYHGQLEPSHGITQRVENDITLHWPLYTGRRIKATIAQASINLCSAESIVMQRKQQVQLEITLAYYKLLESEGALHLADESVIRISEHLRHVKTRLALGTASKLDVVRIELELTNAQQAKIRANKKRDFAAANFNQTLGRPLDEAVTLSESPAIAQARPALRDCLEDALKNRPERLQAENDITVAEYGVILARAEVRPLIALVTSANGSDRHLPGTADDTWSMGVSAHWTLFDSGRTQAKIRQAQAQVIKAQENLKKALNQIELDIMQSCLDLEEAEKLMELSRDALSSAEEEYKMAQAGYEAGYETSLHVLDAQGALSEAKTTYLAAVTNYNASWARLQMARGIILN